MRGDDDDGRLAGSGPDHRAERPAVPLSGWGKEDAPPLVLLHFFTWHARSWDTVASTLGEQYRVLALDQRGHGESDWADDYSPERYLEDLEAFARALDLRRLRLLGFSVGGHAAMRYAALHPDAVERLVLGETLPEQRAPARAYLAAWLGQPDVFDAPDDAVRSARRLVPRPPRRSCATGCSTT